MGKLGDILGEDFEENYESKRERRREEARKVEKEILMEICYEAIEGGGFDGEEPRFRFDAGEVDHDVLLMESPEEDLGRFQWDLGDDAKTQGMYHLNQLFSCAFQENMMHLLEKIDEDEYYLVVGRYQEKTEEQSDGTSETYYNINPVRGIVPLQLAKKYADNYEEQMQGTSVEQQSQEQSSSSSTSDSTNVSTDDSSDDDVEASRDEIIQVFQGVGDEAPEVLESVADGDSDAMDQLVSVTQDNLSGDADRERILDVFEEEVEEIPSRGEDEEDDDDGLDLGGIGSDDDDEDDSEDSVDETSDGSDESSAETEDEDDDGGEEGVDDWF